jgi:hypothetical protein
MTVSNAANFRWRDGDMGDLIPLLDDGPAHDLAVVASAAALWAGADILDPLSGLAITLVILRITWHSWQTVQEGRAAAP